MNINQIVEEAVDFRRELHRFPELSDEEFETSERIQKQLQALDIPFETGFAGTGVLAIIEGKHEGKTVGLRADIDALPIHEVSGESFSSENEGVMHACGHDAHTSMLVAVGKVLMERRDEIHGTVLLIFQPAEEKSPTGGSQRMMDEGIFKGREPDVLLAQHVWPGLPVGQFGVMAGPIMGNSDRFKLIIKGSGGHASMPNDTVDAIIVGTQVVNALQTIVSRNSDPFEPAVVTVGKFQAGSQHNVIAETAEIVGTIRTQSNEMKALVKERFHKIVDNVTEAMGASVEIEYLDGYPATVNSGKWAEHMHGTISKLYGEEALPDLRPSLAGEDFGRFLLKYPGVYYWLGTSIGEGQKPLHNPSFRVNEDAFKYGIEAMSQGAIDTLETLKENQH
ncbi:M20 metallopeptidase family protein [Lacicoccus alkaliphilus]|uniref:Peptidase dimerisation domain-containing protein n=1 Tax=Lacicoccus alkaliphilus DSM 16010 TaxID=1123231 RepID=A0A1M7AKV5_9BACL|nr:Peptidase dimerisation domain-containing protein [Salinicoccus alkaliphilus DSM 16010]